MSDGPRYRDGIEAQADYRIKKDAKEARKLRERLDAERRAIREDGAIDIAKCPTHGLHGRRNACFVCGETVELVAMVPVAERDQLRDLVAALIDPDPCRYDHHGYCQTHSLHEAPCPHDLAKKLGIHP